MPWTTGTLVGLVLGLLLAVPARGADEPALELTRKSIRPGSPLSVRLGPSVDVGRKLFLRVDGGGPVIDIPLDGEAARRRLVRVAFPPARPGTYKTELVTEHGQMLAVGPTLRVLTSEAPVITRIVPRASYPINGRHDFEIVGENFSPHAGDSKIRINDDLVKFSAELDERETRDVVQPCGEKLPCLVGGRRTLRIYGLQVQSPTQTFYRPMMVTVQVDNLTSNDKPLLLAPVGRWGPAFIAFGTLALLAGVVYLFAREKARRAEPERQGYATLAYLFIEPQSNTYSLSRLQLLLWTAGTVIGYTYLAASQFLVQWTWVLPDVPEGLPTLLGISAGTTAFAVGAEARGSKGAGPVHPGLGDFITTGGVFAPERLQFFLWTVLGVGGFVSATLAQDPARVTDLPKIPDNFIPLMGVSSLGYLAGKVLRKSGPVIRQLDPAPPYQLTASGAPAPTIRVRGENLSPRAQVWVNGLMLPASRVAPAQPGDVEFVTELVLTPEQIVSPGPKVAAVKITNPDGQSAEAGQGTPA
jgi:hypothetical protein